MTCVSKIHDLLFGRTGDFPGKVSNRKKEMSWKCFTQIFINRLTAASSVVSFFTKQNRSTLLSFSCT